MDFKLSNKVALITGGARGLGTAICRNMAAEGCNIAINYRNDHKRARLLAEEIEEKYGVKAIFVEGDVTSEEDVKRIFREIISQLGSIDILINNSGICRVSMVKDMDLFQWNSVISTNLTGTFLTSREMINILIAQNKCGKIVNIASQSAFNGSKNGKSHYAASKGGVVTFTLSLAKEVAQYGINVNSVAPGMMYTEMTSETLDKDMDKYKKEIPLGRIAEFDEVARVVVFLASDVSSYITGTTLDVSGGIVGR